MNARAQLALDAPDWVIAQMPPGYQTRVAEIRRLSEELEFMDRFARLLWAIGPDLRDPIRDMFGALKYEVASIEGQGESVIAVDLGVNRRLLLHLSHTEGTIDKKSPEIAQAFKLLHEVASDNDRVAVVVNGDWLNQPANRSEHISAEALKLLHRMGANCVAAPTLFQLWGLSFQELETSRKDVTRLHEQDGGMFVLPA